MKRRELLKGATAATGLGAATSVGLAETGCAHSSHPTAVEAGAPLGEAPLPSAEEIAKVVREMDERLAWIDGHDARAKLFGNARVGAPSDVGEHAEKVRLFRQTMRTLYVTGRFMDLPDEVKMHPEVQARMWAAQPDMDEAVLGMTELLESMGPDDHAAIQSTLRERPDLMEGLASMMEATAKEDGIPVRRRAGLRTTTLSLADRMAKQAPNLVVDPYVRRVRRLQARPIPTTGASRAMVARMGEEAYWQQERRLTDLALRWQRHLAQATAVGGLGAPAGPAAAPEAVNGPAPALPASDTPSSPPSSRVSGAPVDAPAAGSPAAPQAASRVKGSSPPPSPAVSSEPVPPPVVRQPGQTTIKVGGYMMGFGAGSLALGLIFAGLNSAFDEGVFLAGALVFGVTIGPILLIAGLITLIVGAIIKASSSPK